MARSAAVLGALLVAATLVPAATGQMPARVSSELSVTIDPVDAQEAIRPGTTASWTVHVEYRVNEGAVAVNRTEIRVWIDAEPPWATVDVDPTYLYVPVPESPGEATVTNRTRVTIAVAEDAPLPETESYHSSEYRLFVDAEAEANGNVKGSNSEDTAWVLTGHLPRVEASADPSRLELRGDETRDLRVRVRNVGNTEATARLVTDRRDGLTVDGPAEIAVPRDGTAVANLSVGAEGWLASGSRSLDLRALPMRGHLLGPPAELTVPVTVTPLPQAVLLGEQTPLEVAGFSALVVIASLVAGWPMTVWWRRRKGEA